MMEDKVPWLGRPAKCFICYFPRKWMHAKTEQQACEPGIKMWLTGQQRATLGFGEDRGHLTSPGRSALLTTASVY